MGRIVEVVTGLTTAAGAVFTPLVMNAGDALVVRATPLDKKIWLLGAWTEHRVVGQVRIRSPKLHDNVEGIRLSAQAANTSPLFPADCKQLLYPQDTLIVEQTGGGAGVIDSTSLLIAYEDLPGLSGTFIDSETLRKRGLNLVGVQVTLPAAAFGVAGGYCPPIALNAAFDLLKANTPYALIGYLVNPEVCVVRWRGSDIGNVGIGGPGNPIEDRLTRRFFIDLSDHSGLPCIPVFNSANRAAIIIDASTDELFVGAAIACIVTSLFVELTP
jgi:hypothetical protein